MSRLTRIREDMRRSSKIPSELREGLAKTLAEALEKREEIVLALLFGGILRPGKPVRDIDVAIYTGHRVDPQEWPYYADQLCRELEEALRERLGLEKAVDIVVLEAAPPPLRLKALEGRILVCRVPGIRGPLKLHTAEELKALQRRLGKRGASPKPQRLRRPVSG